MGDGVSIRLILAETETYDRTGVWSNDLCLANEQNKNESLISKVRLF